MNDFTKEELKEIQSALSVFAGSPRGNKLFHKIQSLIENYCEHKNTTYDCDYCGLVGCEDCKQACGGELIDV